MVDGVLFDKLVRTPIDQLLLRADCCSNVYQEWIARTVRGIAKPFGGIQVSSNLSPGPYLLLMLRLEARSVWRFLSIAPCTGKVASAHPARFICF